MSELLSRVDEELPPLVLEEGDGEEAIDVTPEMLSINDRQLAVLLAEAEHHHLWVKVHEQGRGALTVDGNFITEVDHGLLDGILVHLVHALRSEKVVQASRASKTEGITDSLVDGVNQHYGMPGRMAEYNSSSEHVQQSL
jgi:hypothetical protein